MSTIIFVNILQILFTAVCVRACSCVVKVKANEVKIIFLLSVAHFVVFSVVCGNVYSTRNAHVLADVCVTLRGPRGRCPLSL